ncbi:MAG TPA: quinone oxidoreductase [Actinomycetota bacterium]|nr:quinone oxidoreductase [Actinomycetota bacterium]
MKAVRVHEHGGPDVLTLDEVPDPEARDGRVVVRLEATGVNFVDVYHRTGLYPRDLPFVPGSEGAGVVVDAPRDSGLTAGDRVASAQLPGAYAEAVAAPPDALVPIPDGVATDVAAAVMVQGITAHYLLRSTCELDAGDWCVVHAAAGGVGLLLTQMARAMGVRVLGTTSTAEKAEKARAAGAEDVVVHSERDFVAVAREVTGGRGVRAVFDGIGKDTFDRSLASLAPRGYMVLYGQASGVVPPFDPRRLAKGSLFLTRPGIADYTQTRAEMLWRAEDVLGAVAGGGLEVHVHGRYPLSEARRAHEDLQSRKTTGKLLLVPG